MNKLKKVKKNIVFFTILFLGITTIIIKDKIILGENEYIVSSNEISSEESVLLDEENNYNKEDNIVIKSNHTGEGLEDKEKNEVITIYISGEVNKTGLLTLENETRLGDAIEILGGLTENADSNKVNLALKVKDEHHYVIPKIGEDISKEKLVIGNDEQVDINEDNTNNSNKMININVASIKELDELPGVGEATANKILRYREENGKFNSIEEIKNVNGIGDKKYEEIKDLISIN
ncbi:MAG: helix-hairpin-helix domain-containing protein [Peptostreptococcaceae bacterium]